MITNFKNKATEDIYNGIQTKVALIICPEKLWKVASRRLDLLDSVVCEFHLVTDWKLCWDAGRVNSASG